MTKNAPAGQPSIPSRALRAFQRLGPIGFVRLVFQNTALLLSGRYQEHRYAYDRSFDLEYGVDTAGTVALDYLDGPGQLKAGAERYEAVEPYFFNFVLDRLEALRAQEYLFVDLGSGKGRALLLAALAGFPRVIGVEFDQGLHRIAENNVEIFRRHCPSAEFLPIHGDAGTFAFPPAPTVLLLNNPFDAGLLEKVLANVELAHGGPSPRFTLLYMHSNHADQVDARPGWERVDEGTFRSSRQFYSIFRWRGAAAAG